jgi:hypothetical protein
MKKAAVIFLYLAEMAGIRDAGMYAEWIGDWRDHGYFCWGVVWELVCSGIHTRAGEHDQ